MRRLVITLLSLAILALSACRLLAPPTPNLSGLSLGQLVAIIEDPEHPDFLWSLAEIETRGSQADAAQAAPALARALRHPRRDSYMAGKAFVNMGMGPDAKTAVPELLVDLVHEREAVRAFAAFALGTIGKPATCAVPELASRLWDPEPEVRAAAAAALDLSQVFSWWMMSPDHKRSGAR